ncbi:hypothetical protein KKD72_00005, partial [Patescibacteria group bacterium]|nr:hypothetical protein [Patescibacteria group bacterium]
MKAPKRGRFLAMPKKNFVSIALFDVRPVDKRGNLDIVKINQAKGLLDLKGISPEDKRRREEAIRRAPLKEKKEFSAENETLTREKILNELMEEFSNAEEFGQFMENASPTLAEQNVILDQYYFPEVAAQKYLKPAGRTEKREIPQNKNYRWPLTSFLVAGFLVALFVPAAAWLNRGIEVKGNVLSSGYAAYQNLLAAKQSLEGADFKSAEESFGLARADFLQIHQSISQVGEITLGILEKLPGGSLVSSGSH